MALVVVRRRLEVVKWQAPGWQSGQIAGSWLHLALEKDVQHRLTSGVPDCWGSESEVTPGKSTHQSQNQARSPRVDFKSTNFARLAAGVPDFGIDVLIYQECVFLNIYPA